MDVRAMTSLLASRHPSFPPEPSWRSTRARTRPCQLCPAFRDVDTSDMHWKCLACEGSASGLVSLIRMETWDSIRARRNVRSYDDRSIAPEHLDRILEAGRRSPSASNRQKWDFVLVVGPAQLHELSTVWVGASHLATAKAAIVLVLPEPESERYQTIDQYDLGQATMVMMLAAADLGIGSGHSGVGDQEACRRILGVPEDRTCAYMLALGYPAARPLKPSVKPARRPFDDGVPRGHW